MERKARTTLVRDAKSQDHEDGVRLDIRVIGRPGNRSMTKVRQPTHHTDQAVVAAARMRSLRALIASQVSGMTRSAPPTVLACANSTYGRCRAS
jgi:hypothetical protein